MVAKLHPFTPDEHLVQARHNERLANALVTIGSNQLDWVVTISFYSALHYIYSKLPPGKEICSNYMQFEKEIASSFSSKPVIYKNYKSLKDKSRNARYYPHIAQHYSKDTKFIEMIFRILDNLKRGLEIN
ncbi:MAG: hypothetical protein WC693_02275 [Patescibacteria group bacterium]|jgi:hypothetical protein